MLPCSVCGTPTLLLVNGTPYCLTCDEEREAQIQREVQKRVESIAAKGNKGRANTLGGVSPDCPSPSRHPSESLPGSSLQTP